jgi:hypothetical protein
MHPVRTLLLAASLVAGSTFALNAQATLRPGTPARGELKSGDLKLDDDTWADLWRFSGQAGQTARVTLRSSDFDAYLVVGYYEEDGDFVDLDSDDDGAGETDSQVEVTLPRDGEYIARANTLSEGESGAYTLELEFVSGGGRRPATSTVATGLVSTVPGQRMAVTLGATLRGRLEAGDDLLSDGSPADIWVYQGKRGETLTMIQRSRDHDSYLTFGRVVNGRWVWEESNDDDAGGDDSKLVVTLKEDGEYWVRPNALNKGTGEYTLVVTSDRAGGGRDQPAPRRDVQVRRDRIEAGQTVRGELSETDEFNFDTTYVDTYVYEGKRGEVLEIYMMSPSFGSYVLFGKAVRDPATFSSIDTKGATRGAEAQLVVTVPEDGRYWIRANSFEKTTGSYTLTVKRRRR